MSTSTIRPKNGPILPDRGPRIGYGMDRRVYRPSWWMRLFGAVVGALIVAAGLFGIWYLTSHPGPLAGNMGIGVLFCALYILIASLKVADLLRIRVILTADAIEYVGSFRHRRLARRDIEGYRVIYKTIRFPALAWYNWRRLIIVPVAGAGRPLRIRKFFRLDEPFRAWLAGLSDLDEPVRREAETEILSNPAWGETAAERSGALVQARRTVSVLGSITIALVGLATLMFNPPAIPIVLLIGMPWVAMAINARHRGVFVSVISHTEIRPTLFIPLFLPGLILAVRAAIDYQPVEWLLPIGAGVVAGGFFAAAVVFADNSVLKNARNLVILPFAVAYGFGIVAQANARFDTAPPIIERATVITKTIQGNGHGWLAIRRTYLRLSPWGPRTLPEDVGVSEGVWNAVRLGQTVCVNIHPGALRMAWLTVAACPSVTPPRSPRA